MANVNVDDMTPAERARFETKREQEFYSYYEPIRALAQNEMDFTDLNSKEAVANHVPKPSPDRALTAFCQLAAIRMQMRRAMIFFFDSKHAYILAEATRTLSLQDDAVTEEEEDSLWLGSTRIPRGFSVCEHTVCLPSNGGSNAENEDSHIVHIINNLTEDTRFCSRPYVVDGPRARFYAGVPITTPKGLKIGAFCVLDDTPHEGLAPKEVGFLQEMGAAVMSHLELIRAKVENRRGANMVSALSMFTAGSLDSDAPKTTGNDKLESPRDPPSIRCTPYKQEEGRRPSHRRLSTNTHRGDRMQTSENTESPKNTPDRPIRPLVLSQSRKRSSVLLSTLSTYKSSSVETSATGEPALVDPKPESIDTSPRAAVFRSAASLIRGAVNADGVVFLDPTVANGFGSFLDSSLEDFPGLDADTTGASATDGTDGTEGITSGAEERSNKTLPRAEEVDEKPCPVLGASYGNFGSDSPSCKIPEGLTPGFLRTLLRRFKGGRVWNFSENGEDYSDDQTSESHASDGGIMEPSKILDTNRNSQKPKRRKKLTKKALSKHLALAFPGVRGLMLLGLWDPLHDQWRAACVVWSCTPMRMFSNEGEMHYLTAFCDVIMAKLARVDVELANNVKSDFISSISHELRSPLHGILGTIEVLQDQTYDFDTTEMIAQIDTCGRTLLDIVDHLLDFSKINVLAKHSGDKKDLDLQSRTELPSSIKDQKSRDRGMSSADVDVSLDLITEEVVESAVYSFCCSKDQRTLSERHVTVSINIEDHKDIPWNCKINAGAWKRVCVNLINNALKYTQKGFINVSLKIIPPANKLQRPVAQLTVEDSGRGMSKNFLQNHLFRAFTQEDELVEGTGLGLSMVARIVKAWKGQVNVQSTKGAGSTFRVTMPMDANRLQQANPRPLLTRSGISVHVLGSTELQGAGPIDAGRNRQLSSMRKMLSGVGLSVTGPSWQPSTDNTFNFITEAHVPSLVQLLTSSLTDWNSKPSASIEALQTKPLLVLCKDYMSARLLKSTRLGQLVRRLEYVAQPCGPRRLLTAIEHIIDPSRYTSMPNTQSSTPMTPSTPINPSTPHATSDENPDPFTPVQTPRPLTPCQGDWREGSAWRDQQPEDRAIPTEGTPSESAELSFVSPTVPDRHQPRRLSNLQSPTGLGLNYSQIFSQPQEAIPTMQLPKRSAPLLSEVPSSKMVKPKTVVKNAIDPSKPRLLLVDDNPINLQLLITYSKKNGHAMLTATNGLEAVEAYKTACSSLTTPTKSYPSTSSSSSSPPTPSLRPQVILMDVSMPILDGFAATRQIRAFERQQQLLPATIIALTGLGSAEARHEAFISGINLFLTKPVRLKELTKLLDGINEATPDR